MEIKVITPPQYSVNKRFMKNAYTIYGFLVFKSTDEEKQAMVGIQKIDLERNQLITCRREISEATGLSETKVYRTLQQMSKIGLCKLEPINLYTKITLEKINLPFYV